MGQCGDVGRYGADLPFFSSRHCIQYYQNYECRQRSVVQLGTYIMLRKFTLPCHTVTLLLQFLLTEINTRFEFQMPSNYMTI